MGINLNVAFNLVGAGLNALDISTYTAVGTQATLNDTERRSVHEIYDALNSADGDVVRLILQTPGHGQRAGFLLTQSNIANPGDLVSRIGPIEWVNFVVAGGSVPGTYQAWEFDKLEIGYENRNAQGLGSIDPHYWVEGSRLYHNAAGYQTALGVRGVNGTVTVNAKYGSYTRSTSDPPVLLAPDEYMNAVVAKTLAMILPKEGHHTEAGNYYQGVWAAYAQDILQGSSSLRSLATLAGERAPQAQPVGAGAGQ